MHTQFGIDRRDMIANGVERQIETRRDFLVRQPLANQFQHIALARREIAGVKSGLIGPVDAFHVGQFFNQGLAEPGSVLHHFLDGAHQLQLRAFAFGNVHEHQQVAGRIVNAKGIRRGHAVDRLAPFLAYPDVQPLGVTAFFQRGKQTAVRLGIVNKLDLIDRFADQGFGVVLGGAGEGFVDVQHAPLVRRTQQRRHRAQAKCLGEPLFTFPQRRFRLTPGFEIGKSEQHAVVFIDVQRLAGNHHQLASATGQFQLGLHLRNGCAFPQALNRQLFVLSLFQHVEFIDRTPHDLFTLVTGHIEEPLIDLDVTQVA